MNTQFLRLLSSSILLGLLVLPAFAQRLMWENAFLPINPTGRGESGYLTLAPNQRFLLIGGHQTSTSGTACQTPIRAYFRTYTLAGALIQEKLGRSRNGNGGGDYATSSPTVGWLTAPGNACVGTRRYSRAFVQRLTIAGDTGRAWYLGAVPPPTRSGAILVQRNKIIVAGDVMPTTPAGQVQQVQLTCSDTLGRVRWQRTYPRLPSALDYAAAVVATPRGGYLISGDAYNFAASGYDHYVLETDSAGLFRRSRLIQPLGPGYNNGYRVSYQCNVLVLPNAQGYLLSGTADSSRQFTSYARIGYVMRLDTALNVQWVYRHPPALGGTGTDSNYAFRIRQLSNGTVGVLLTDVRGPGTPDVFLAQLNIATGQRIGRVYVMSSNTQSVVIPYDWQWVGDGTLLLCGKSSQLGVTYQQSYVARWDFRSTPLAARTADEATAMATFTLSPNPSTGPVTIEWQLPPAARAGQLRLYSPLGQLVKTLPLPPTASGRLEVAGLPPGLYLARLLDAAGAGQGRAQRLLVRE